MKTLGVQKPVSDPQKFMLLIQRTGQSDIQNVTILLIAAVAPEQK